MTARNTIRTKRLKAILQAYKEATHDPHADDGTAIVDLLADMQHYCRTEGAKQAKRELKSCEFRLDFDYLMNVAAGHVIAETTGTEAS